MHSIAGPGIQYGQDCVNGCGDRQFNLVIQIVGA
jgi:hypothetical protein